MKFSSRVEQVASVCAIGFLVMGCVVVVRPFLTTILWSAILCYATWPLFLRLEKMLGNRRTLAAAAMTLCITMLLVVPLALVGLTFVENLSRLIQVIQSLMSGGIPTPPQWVQKMPLIGSYAQSVWMDMAQNTDKIIHVVKNVLIASRGWMLGHTIEVFKMILELVLGVFILFFFYRDGEDIIRTIARGGRRLVGDYIQRMIEVVGSTVKGVVFGILGAAVAQGLTAGIGFEVAGVPSPFLLGLITFVLAAVVPMGPPLVWVPAAAWLFYQGDTKWSVFLALWGVLVISNVDHIIKPVVISRNVDLPFVLVLLGVMGGLLAFGVIGVFLGPVVLASGYAMMQEYMRQQETSGPSRRAAPVPEASASERKS